MPVPKRKYDKTKYITLINLILLGIDFKKFLVVTEVQKIATPS